MALTFPEDWPADCPPPDAGDAAGDVYRLVKHSPGSAGDFLTHHESGRLPNAPACLRCGLSVFRTAEDASHQRRLFPRIGQFIAKGELSAEHGKAKLTPGQLPTHTTWWPFVGVDRASLFAVLDEGAD